VKLKNLKDLLVHELRDLYDAERQITNALPAMAEKAKSSELKDGLKEHLKQTKEQTKRLDRAFDHLGVSVDGQECVGMRGLIEEGEKIMNENADPNVMDAALVATAQKVEHYEIASYGTARAYARLLGDDELDMLLLKTLDEEGRTDEKLSQLAMTSINPEALHQRS
jgi:ferritin-like metal-binding protein YciE